MKGTRVVFRGVDVVDLETFEVDPPKRGEVCIKTTLSVISPGTERANLLAAPNTDTAVKGFPFYPGYSNVGTVLAVGERVSEFSVGRIVVSNGIHASHVTALARALSQWRESDQPSPAISTRAWPVPLTISTPEHLGSAAVFMLSVIGLSAVRRSLIDIGSSTVVIGLGPIGLAAAEWARLAGAFPVMGYDVSPNRRQRALSRRLDGIYETLDQLLGVPPGSKMDRPAIVFDATGHPETLPIAIKACRPGGKIVLLGSPRGVTTNVEFYEIHRNALQLIGAHQTCRPTCDSTKSQWTQDDDCRLALELIGANRVCPKNLVTHEFPSGRVKDAYHLIKNGDEALAVMLSWV